MDYIGVGLASGLNLEKMEIVTPQVAFGWHSMYLRTELDSTLFGEPDMTIRRTDGDTINFTGGRNCQVSKRSISDSRSSTPLSTFAE